MAKTPSCCRIWGGGTANAAFTVSAHHALMDRRALLTAGALVAVATRAHAAEEEEPSGPGHYDLTVVGLPVIETNRIRNYIFVRLRLHVAAGHDPMSLRGKDPHIRDSLVRMAHRSPFTVAGERNRLNAGAMAGHVMATAMRVCGRGVVTRVEVIGQQPQRRVA